MIPPTIQKHAQAIRYNWVNLGCIYQPSQAGIELTKEQLICVSVYLLHSIHFLK